VKLSVIVPFYNVERYIHDCLASIAGQTLRDLEVILVDDGSPDGSRAIAEKFVAEDPRFKLVTQKNAGLGPARNTGIGHATGTYLTFVDSDDVIPRDAFRVMTERLDRSGSDFAAGDARRFNIHGVRESWVHVVPFADDIERADVRRMSLLATDRMVWNKVYRRSFWEKHGYAFPAMLYEDYPVTLRAYLDADGVEIVSQPIYLWRERDEGELSITQRAFELRNINDRVTSDLMVLAQVEPGTGVPAPVRHKVHDLFLSSDVGAVARAMAFSVGEPDHDALVDAAQRLVRSLDTEVVARRTRMERLRCDLITAGRADVLRHVVDIGDGFAPAPTHVRRGRRTLLAFDGDAFADLPTSLRVLADADLEQHVQVTTARWTGSDLGIGIRAVITFSGPATAPAVRAWLVERDGGRRLDARVDGIGVVNGSDVVATVHVDGPALLALAGDRTTSWELMVELDTGSVRRQGLATRIKQGSAMMAQAWRGDDQHWIVSGRDLGNYIVRTLRPAAWLTGVDRGYGDELALSGRTQKPLPLQGALLEIASDERELHVPLSVDPFDPTRWDAHVHLGLISDPRHHDEYVPATTEYRVHLLTPRERHPVHADPATALDRFLHRGRELQVVSGRFLGARIDETDPEFVLEEATVAGTVLSIAGRWLGPSSTSETAVLRWHHTADQPEEHDVTLRMEGDRFSFEVDVAELSARMRRTLDASTDDAPQLDEEEWLLSFEHADRAMTAFVGNALVRTLPDPIPTPDGTVELTTHRRFAARLVVSGLRR
jgi:CDP-glycerol glycerophosphotransferase